MSNSVHSGRPLTISRTSFMTSGRMGARRGTNESGERKEYILQCGFPALRAKLIKRADTAHPTIRKQHEAVTDALGIHQLVDGENEGSPPACHLAQHAHDLARLSQIESVEGLIHEQEWLRCQKRERQHEPSIEAFGQRADPFTQHRCKPDGTNDRGNLLARTAV